jgi:hypothetical protein
MIRKLMVTSLLILATAVAAPSFAAGSAHWGSHGASASWGPGGGSAHWGVNGASTSWGGGGRYYWGPRGAYYGPHYYGPGPCCFTGAAVTAAAGLAVGTALGVAAEAAYVPSPLPYPASVVYAPGGYYYYYVR